MKTMDDIDKEFPDFNYATIIRRNEKDFLFDMYGDGKKQVWIPISQMELEESTKYFNIPRWLAVEKELI